MATSFVNYQGHGFWVSGGLLELWLYLLASEIRKLPQAPAWLRETGVNWQLQSQEIATGWVYLNLDEYLTDPSRKEICLSLSEAAQLTIQDCGGAFRREYFPGLAWDPENIAVSEVQKLAVQFVRLLEGDIISTASSPDATPQAWSDKTELSDPNQLRQRAPSVREKLFTTLKQLKSSAPSATPRHNHPLPQPENVFTFQEYKGYLKKSYPAWQQVVHSPRIPFSKHTAHDILLHDQKKAILAQLLEEYQARLPVYLLARCPICGGRVYEAVDTFCLDGFGWNHALMEPSGRGWLGFTHLGYRSEYAHASVSYKDECQHTRLMLYGVHLNGCKKFEDMGWGAIFIGSEQPYIIPPLLELSDTFAVMHSLPLGRLSDDTYLPRYTIYFTTYFTTQGMEYHNAIAPYRTRHGLDRISPYEAADYNLLPWAKRGRLYWLDQRDPDLPLATMPHLPEEFPYAEINGRQGRWCLRRTRRKSNYTFVQLEPFENRWFEY